MSLLSRIYSQTGDEKGIIPIFATVKANAMVAKGADRALPMTVRRSKEIPKVDNHNKTVKTNLESECNDFKPTVNVERMILDWI